MNNSDIRIDVPCSENAGNETTFETSSEGLMVTTLSSEMGCELVTCINTEAAKHLLSQLLAALNQPQGE